MSVDEFKLIDLVELNPALWDNNSVFYRDKTHKSDIWDKIAKELGCAVMTAETGWQRLREKYSREKRAKQTTWDKMERLSSFLNKADSSNQPNISLDDINLENLSLTDNTDIGTMNPTIKMEKHETDISSEIPVAPSTSTPFPTNKNKTSSKCEKFKVQDPESNDDLNTSLLSPLEKVALNMGRNLQIPRSRNTTESFIQSYVDQMYDLFENIDKTKHSKLRGRFSTLMNDLCEEFGLY